MSECKHTRAFCRSLEAQGALTYPLVGGKMQPPGWPDRYVAHKRWSGFLECKSFEGKVDARQQLVISGLRARGVSVYVLRFSADGSEFQILCDWYKWGKFFDVVESIEGVKI